MAVGMFFRIKSQIVEKRKPRKSPRCWKPDSLNHMGTMDVADAKSSLEKDREAPQTGMARCFVTEDDVS